MKKLLFVLVLVVLTGIAWLVLYLGSADERWFQSLSPSEQVRIQAIKEMVENLPPRTLLIHSDGRLFMVVSKSGMYVQVKESPLGRTDTIATSYEMLSKLRVVKFGDPDYERLVMKFWNR